MLENKRKLFFMNNLAHLMKVKHEQQPADKEVVQKTIWKNLNPLPLFLDDFSSKNELGQISAR